MKFYALLLTGLVFLLIVFIAFSKVDALYKNAQSDNTSYVNSNAIAKCIKDIYVISNDLEKKAKIDLLEKLFKEGVFDTEENKISIKIDADSFQIIGSGKVDLAEKFSISFNRNDEDDLKKEIYFNRP